MWFLFLTSVVSRSSPTISRTRGSCIATHASSTRIPSIHRFTTLFLHPPTPLPSGYSKTNIVPTKNLIPTLDVRWMMGARSVCYMSSSKQEQQQNQQQRQQMGEMSSYDIDMDEEAEQFLSDHPTISMSVPVLTDAINGDTSSTSFSSSSSSSSSTTTTIHSNNMRYSTLLQQVGLQDQISTTVSEMPNKRTVGFNDIFCNRELKLGGIRAIGFDMDYTLAQYQQPAFDNLAFEGAKQKLVYSLGYPKEVLDLKYDHNFWVRGLIIDTQRGNFLKIDRHKYVRVAYHGYNRINSKTRKFLYRGNFNKVESFTEKHYINMDTLFQFVDASLFASLVDMKDEGEFDVLDMKTYEEIYRQVRECVDLCHRDGVIKDEVARNPHKYLIVDPDLVPMLQKFREDGIKVFLLTNSYWEYTSVVMNYLYHQHKVNDELKKKNEWMELFNLVVVGSCKPAYLLDPYLNLFRVRPEDGSLLNTDGLFEIEAYGENGAQKFLNKGKVFQGGNWKHLNAMLEISAGEDILYVGDHLYSDVLRSKRTLGWRSAFIMPELVQEMKTFHQQLPLRNQILGLRKLRDDLAVHRDELMRSWDKKDATVQEKILNIDKDDETIKRVLSDLAAQYHGAFHPVWGMMFVAGYQDSRFAYFVQNYACLYTAKATNFAYASTTRSFRTSGEMLPHDKLLADEYSSFMYDGDL